MDSYKEIVKLIDLLPDEDKNSFNVGVITHLTRGEFYFNQGIKYADHQYFTDTIYRTNHAYEGILRESYSKLAKKDSTGINTNQIEEYFEKNAVFNTRVKNMFMQYRREWRNPSTHDHNTFFEQNEAFLAILSVSGFIYVLLNQIVKAITYDNVKDVIKPSASITLYSSLYDKIVHLLTTFNKEIEKASLLVTHAAQLEGTIKAYLERHDNEIVIENDYSESKLNIERLDLVILEESRPSILIELKMTNKTVNEKEGLELLQGVLSKTNINKGILYYFNPQSKEVYEEKEIRYGNNRITIIGSKLGKNI